MFAAMRITTSWILSKRAQRIYFTSSLLTIGLFVLLFLLALATETRQPLPIEVAAPIRLLLFATVLGSATLWVGMLYFWLQCGREQSFWRAIWFVFLLIGVPVTSILYYWFAYRPYIAAGTSVQAAGAAAASQKP